MIVGPMHEKNVVQNWCVERSRIQMQKFQEEHEIQKIEESLKPLCMVKDLNDGMSGVIFPQVMAKFVEAVRTTLADMQVPRFGRNRRRR